MKTAIQSELDLLLDAIHCRYGYDFRNYSRPFVERRLKLGMTAGGHDTTLDYLASLLRHEDAFDDFLKNQSIVVTEMFRDPSFFAALRARVVPELRARPVIRIWHAGCATGEEAYSLAILLHEEGLLDRCHIYATDFNKRALAAAKEGTYDFASMRTYSRNYYQAGGRADFSDYYRAAYGVAKIAGFLRERTVFSYHSLAQDPPLEDIDLVLCRNVMIYFDQALRARTLRLFATSLLSDGFLGVGALEDIVMPSGEAPVFVPFDSRAKLYVKAGGLADGRLRRTSP